MTPVNKEELSALLDGELESKRAAVVRAAIAADPALHAEYEALVRLDAGLVGAAAEAGFMPDIVLAPAAPSAPHWMAGLAVVVVLLGVRLLPKLMDLALVGVLLQIVAAGIVLALIMSIARDPHAASSKLT